MSCQRLRQYFRVTNGFRQYATKCKVEIDQTVIKSVKSTSCTRHSGQTHSRKVLRMPQDIEDTIMKILKEQDYKTLIDKGMAFVRHLHGRHPPLETNELENLAKTEDFKIQQKLQKKQSVLSSEKYSKLVERAPSVLKRKIRVQQNLWKPVVYDDQKCFQYLLLRGPADYAVLKVVLSEIVKRDPDFKPKSLLDFGSGVGTVSWVVQELWKTCNEFYNVDICQSMKELAGLVLKRGNPQTHLSPSIFFKGFLPTSLKYTHDIVVSAYSLLELPSRKQRLETLLSLWNKAESYLVIVEDGTYAGYKVVIEARDFILEMAEREESVAGGTGAHVFAPCAHDRACPKFLTSRIPCNFEVSYMQHPTVQSSQPVRERYSYVVLKRGARQSTPTAWPRIVAQTKIRSNHCVARLCTSEGELQEIILSKGKNSDGTYKLLKYSMWGDTIPFTLTSFEDEELPSKERHRLEAMERRQAKGEQQEDVEEEQEDIEEDGDVNEEHGDVKEEHGDIKGKRDDVREKEQSNS